MPDFNEGYECWQAALTAAVLNGDRILLASHVLVPPVVKLKNKRYLVLRAR